MSNPTTSSCPGCGAPADPIYRPFCSRGCRDRDLLDWFDERHRIPVGEAEPDDIETLDSRDRDPL